MMYLNLNYQNVTVADYDRLLDGYSLAIQFKDIAAIRRIEVRMYILDKLIKKGEKIG
ncbi:hypothetical protein P4G96_10590 [Bacillus cereus]|nr:hypothetical protein [Bacillus cereus]MEB8666273.1 hypothetical protein [Bacillus cereus]